MPNKKMILTQNLVFNLPLCLVMTMVGTIKGGGRIHPGIIVQYLIGLVVMEILGLVIPKREIAVGMGKRFFPGKDPMGMPQSLLSSAVISLLFTIPMSLVMSTVGLTMGGQPLSLLPFSFIRVMPWTYLASTISVMILLPLSMKVSGMDRMGPPPQRR